LKTDELVGDSASAEDAGWPSTPKSLCELAYVLLGGVSAARRGIDEREIAELHASAAHGAPARAWSLRLSMATLNRTPSAELAPEGESAVVGARAAPPHLLRCLVVSASAERRRLIREAAEAQAWDAIVCRDAGEFLRVAFKRSVPLVLIDLPRETSAAYWELREAADRASHITQSLILIAGSGAESGEELWVRSLGAWAYLSDAHVQRGFEFVLSEAREAIARNENLLAAETFRPGAEPW
jgi:hypothetical protein